MAHGTPDWGVTAGAVTTYQLTDLAELAVRLGSIVSFDRRGDVLWLDGFEGALIGWTTYTEGTGAAVGLSAARSRNGGYSALLTAGSDDSRVAAITHLEPFPAVSRFGAELSFSLDSTIETIDLIIANYDGTNLTVYYLRWDDTVDELQYRDADDNFQTLAATDALRRDQTLFHTLKLVVDGSANEYVRAILNGSEYDLAGIGGSVSASASDGRLSVQGYLTGLSGQNDTIYVDDVILTQNEPA